MPHVLALDEIDEVLGDVLRVVADAFQRLDGEGDVEDQPDVAGIRQDAAGEVTQRGLELVVQFGIAARYLNGAFNVQARERLAQYARGQPRHRHDVAQQPVTGCETVRLVDMHRHARNALGVVADTLEIGDGLAERQDGAQVAPHRLAQRQQADDALVGLDIDEVDRLVTHDHLARQFGVTVGERIDGVVDLLFDEPAHAQHQRAEIGHLIAEVSDGVALVRLDGRVGAGDGRCARGVGAGGVSSVTSVPRSGAARCPCTRRSSRRAENSPRLSRSAR